jgi:RNA polymerase sigma factor (sigma-70 family)
MHRRDDDHSQPGPEDQLPGWLDRLAAGDPEARDRIVELVTTRLRTLAHRMLSRFPQVRRWDDTDDVCQMAALRLHRSLGRMTASPPREVMALATTHLHRTLIDLARRHAGPQSHAANHETNVLRMQPGGAVEHRVERAGQADDDLDRWERFHAAIDALPSELREVFVGIWYLGADQRQLAGWLGCSDRTIKSRWRRARDAVRTALDGTPPE